MGTRREEARVQWVVVTRIKRYAGGLILVPQADVHQPSFYIVRFVGSGPVNRLRQLSALALGLLPYDPAVHLEAADWVRIDGNRTVPVQIDGEVLGVLTFGFGGMVLLVVPFIENRAGRKAAMALTATGIAALLYVAIMTLAGYLA